MGKITAALECSPISPHTYPKYSKDIYPEEKNRMSYQNPKYEGWYVVTATRYNHIPADLDALVPAIGKDPMEALVNVATRSLWSEHDEFRLFKPVTKKGPNGPVFDRNDLSLPVANSYIRTDVNKVRDYAAARPDTDFSLVLSTFDRGGTWGGAPGQVYRTDIINKEQTHYYSWFDICQGKLQHISFSTREDMFWVGRLEEGPDIRRLEYYIPDAETKPVKFLIDIVVFSALVRYNDPDPNHTLGGLFFDDRNPEVTVDKFLTHQQEKARGIVENIWKRTHWELGAR